MHERAKDKTLELACNVQPDDRVQLTWHRQAKMVHAVTVQRDPDGTVSTTHVTLDRASLRSLWVWLDEKLHGEET